MLDREPLVFAHGPPQVERVAISTGGAGHDLIAAAHDGYDLFLTGEAEEPSLHTARELGIHFVAGGHYATEQFGVQALAERLAERSASTGSSSTFPIRSRNAAIASAQAVRPLADQQVAAVGDRPQRRAQPARVLECVVDRHLPVAGAPEDERRSADALEVEPRVVADEHLQRAPGIGVPLGAREEPEHLGRVERGRIRRAPVAERDVAGGGAPARDDLPARGDTAAELQPSRRS